MEKENFYSRIATALKVLLMRINKQAKDGASLPLEESILVIIKMASMKDSEFKFFPMVSGTKANGGITNVKVVEL
jgi:hypothetical protein